MQEKKPQQIEVPALPLQHTTSDEYCLLLRKCRGLSFWWYQDPSNRSHSYSRPFQDKLSVWWYQVKPGLAWPVNILNAQKDVNLPFYKRYLGYQYVIGKVDQANSYLAMNVIQDLALYSSASLTDKRRAVVRKGLRLCSLNILSNYNKEVIGGCWESWNNLVSRTGWKTSLSHDLFEESWRKLMDLPGTSIIVGHDKETGRVAGFLIVKIIDQTAYVDTIASEEKLLSLNINDALMYAFLINAQQIPHAKSAHYALVSSVTNLERFKRSLGFIPTKYPARTFLTPGVGVILKLYYQDKYNRLIGNI